MRLQGIMFGISGLLLVSCSVSSDFNQGVPFTKKQIIELKNGLEKGITYQQVKEILGREDDTVWRYNSNSGTVPITVREFHDSRGHSVIGHFNEDDVLVVGTHDVTTFDPE